MDQIKIGKYIQGLRKEQGLTQRALADKLGVSPQAISKWELGETLPDCSIILELCEILKTNADMLLHGGSYLVKDRALMRIKDVEAGFNAMEDIKKYFGEKSLFYIGMIEGINNKMNMDIESHLNDLKHRQVLIAEVLLQGIHSGKYYVDINEVRSFFKNPKLVEFIETESNKI